MTAAGAASAVPDHYATLGVPRTATQDEIKQAYRKLARKYHPDVSKLADAESRFKALGEANQVLKDPDKRAAYDRGEARAASGRSHDGSPFHDSPFTGRYERGEGFGQAFDGAGDPEDLLEALFARQRRGGGRGRAARRPGEDYQTPFTVDLPDAYTGATRSVRLQVPQPGGATAERTLDVHIPKGIRAGQRLRLAGQGGPGHNAPAGDLYLEVSFAEHPFFRVDGTGRDVFLDLPVAPWEAALGATIEAPTPDGKVQLTIPPDTAQGRTLRLAGKGLPGSGGSANGHLYAVIRLVLPKADSEAARKLYADMRTALPFDPRVAMGLGAAKGS